MSRRLRQRREAIESRYIAMAEDTDDMDWEEDGDFEMIGLYRDHEIPAPMEDAQCQQ